MSILPLSQSHDKTPSPRTASLDLNFGEGERVPTHAKRSHPADHTLGAVAAIPTRILAMQNTYISRSQFDTKYVAQSFVDSTVSMSDFESMSELAVIILSRAHLRKGTPQAAHDLLSKYSANNEASESITIELAKVISALGFVGE